MASGMLSGQEIFKTLELRALENIHTRDSSLLLRMANELIWAALGCTDLREPLTQPSPGSPRLPITPARQLPAWHTLPSFIFIIPRDQPQSRASAGS